MDKPRYMQLFCDEYLEDTEGLELEEQGAYMRLMCKMWKRDGRIPNDDREIARMLGVHTNKWTKIKPYLMPFFLEHSPGFLTQKRLRRDYKRVVDKMKGKGNTPDDTGEDTPPDTPQDTYGVTPQDTPHDTPPVSGGKNEQNQQSDEEKDKKFSPGELDLEESSRSVTNTNTYKGLEEDGGGENCGKLPPEKLADVFLSDLRAVFNEYNVDMPRDHAILSGWIEDGISLFGHILPSVRKVLARLSGGTCDPPKSWKYFAREVYRKQKTGGHHGKAKK